VAVVLLHVQSLAYPEIFFFFFGGGVTPGIFSKGGSTNPVEDRGQRELGSGGGSPLVRGSTRFANERNPYYD
jgi:hypothetical protein